MSPGIYGAQNGEGTVLPQVGGRLSHTQGQDRFFGVVLTFCMYFFHISCVYKKNC